MRSGVGARSSPRVAAQTGSLAAVPAVCGVRRPSVCGIRGRFLWGGKRTTNVVHAIEQDHEGADVAPVQRLAAELNTEDLEHAHHKLELRAARAVVVERHDLLALRRLLDKRGALHLRLALCAQRVDGR
eukprot:scaffold43213_cov72-Phaeocystis_antarctica.AAC.2